MKNILMTSILAFLTLVFVGQVPAQSADVKTNKADVEKIVREYLISNPEIIREALIALQAKEEKQKELQAGENIKKFRAEIYEDADSPVLGNEKGDIAIVVFYDYFCGYCRRSMPSLNALLDKDSSLRIVFKELPIINEGSMVAAKAVLAAARQGKFEAFHQAMLASPSASDPVIKAIAAKVGLDYVQLQKDMDDPKIAAAIDRNLRLAESLDVDGTPAYLVGGQFIPGAIDAESLTRIIRAERAKLAKPGVNKAAAPKGSN